MGRRLLLANLVILAGIIVLAQQMIESWQQFQGVPAITPLESRSLDLEDPPVEPRPAALPQFLVISEKNLFTQNRGNEPPDDGSQDQSAPELPVEPKLVSVSSFGGVKEAVLEVFEGRRGQQSDRRVVKLGDNVQGYQVSEIDADSLTLAWQDVRRVINLEPSRAQPRQAARGASGVNIITVGSAVAGVETTTPAAEEEAGRSLEVDVVAAQQQGRGQQGRGAQGAGLRGGRGQGGLSSGGRRGFNPNNQRNQGLPGTVGFGQQPQLPPPQSPPR